MKKKIKKKKLFQFAFQSQNEKEKFDFAANGLSLNSPASGLDGKRRKLTTRQRGFESGFD